ncbi:MAG: hypothetical protein OXP09_12385 [Gammaproteobacteria bacterium]|nr:hypothetical protein [Gammaproteobacteria bacterium]MDE0366359.1 hypothetical protein [Gammaproteobacteria bacterium]
MAVKRGKRLPPDRSRSEEAEERRRGSVPAKVEHPFPHVKRYSGCSNVRDRGLAMNSRRIAMLLEFANRRIAGRHAPG